MLDFPHVVGLPSPQVFYVLHVPCSAFLLGTCTITGFLGLGAQFGKLTWPKKSICLHQVRALLRTSHHHSVRISWFSPLTRSGLGALLWLHLAMGCVCYICIFPRFSCFVKFGRVLGRRFGTLGGSCGGNSRSGLDKMIFRLCHNLS